MQAAVIIRPDGQYEGRVDNELVCRSADLREVCAAVATELEVALSILKYQEVCKLQLIAVKRAAIATRERQPGSRD